MPKIKPLTSKSREAEFNLQCNDVFSLAVRTNKGRTGVLDKELAERMEVVTSTLHRLKKPESIDDVSFGTIRKGAHACKMSQEEWLRLGGYGKKEATP